MQFHRKVYMNESPLVGHCNRHYHLHWYMCTSSNYIAEFQTKEAHLCRTYPLIITKYRHMKSKQFFIPEISNLFLVNLICTLTVNAFCSPLRSVFIGVAIALTPPTSILYTGTNAFRVRCWSLSFFLK